MACILLDEYWFVLSATYSFFGSDKRTDTAQKQIRRKLRIRSHLVKKSLMETSSFVQCIAVSEDCFAQQSNYLENNCDSTFLTDLQPETF